MNLIGLLLLLYTIRLYYRRKWEGKLGAPLDLGWILKRVRPDIGVGCTIIECRYEKPNLVFLAQRGDSLEWHYYAHSPMKGWHPVTGRSWHTVSPVSPPSQLRHPI